VQELWQGGDGKAKEETSMSCCMMVLSDRVVGTAGAISKARTQLHKIPSKWWNGLDFKYRDCRPRRGVLLGARLSQKE